MDQLQNKLHQAIIEKNPEKTSRKIRSIAILLISTTLLLLTASQNMMAEKKSNQINPVTIGIMSEEERLYIKLMKEDISLYETLRKRAIITNVFTEKD